MKTRPVTYQGYQIGWTEIYEFGPKANTIKQITITDVDHIEWLRELDYFYVDLDDDD